MIILFPFTPDKVSQKSFYLGLSNFVIDWHDAVTTLLHCTHVAVTMTFRVRLKKARKPNQPNLVVMTFRVRLKKARKPNQPRLRFDLEKLRDPDVVCTFQAMIGGKFAPLIGLSDEDMDIDTMIATYNTAVIDAANEILGKERRRKKPWVT